MSMCAICNKNDCSKKATGNGCLAFEIDTKTTRCRFVGLEGNTNVYVLETINEEEENK